MPVPPLHLLCAELGLIAYAPGFLTNPVGTLMAGLATLPAGRSLHTIIMGKDPLVGPVPFGFITEGDEGYIVTIRGTQLPGGSIVEWLDDFDAVLEPCPWAPAGCQWHRGFGRVYGTLTVGAMKLGAYLTGLKASSAKTVTASGHSLGGPLATFAAGEAGLDAPVLFATPKPGNAALRVWLSARWLPLLGLHQNSYANPNDAVPKVPITVDWPLRLFDFAHVFDLCELAAGTAVPPVGPGWGESHALGNYLRLLEAAL